MQTFKERVDKILGSVALGEDLVDDFMMVNDYRLKKLITYGPLLLFINKLQ